MDSSEDAAAAKRSSINDASPTAVQQASTEPKTTEANMGVHQHINSTTEIQMEMPSLHDYITKLSEEEWESIAADMSNPVTKSQFLTVCLNIANYITSSALHVIIPSLIKRLGEDPELLMGSEEDRGNINVIGTCPDSRSSTSLHTTSLPQHGMTKEHILQSVQRSLTKLNEAGLTPDSDEWIEAIFAEVVHAVDSLLKSRPHSTGCASPHQRSRITEIAKNISLKLKTYLTQQCKTSKETIGDILINKVKAVHSTSTRPFSSPISVLGSEINMEEDERSPSCSPQPIHSVSSMIVNTFVEELSSLIECTECRRQSHADQEINEIKNGEPFAVPKSQVLEAAKGLYVKVQAKITQFFKNPLIVCCKGLSTPDIDRMEAKVLQSMEAPSAQYSQHPGVQPTSIGSEQLLRPAWPLLRKMHSDGTYCVALGELNLTKTQLEECTNNALGGVLTSFLSQESEEPCSSSSTNTFMERVIFQLDSLISTSSLTTSVSSSDHSSKYSLVNFMRISDSTSTNSSSNLQKLSSEAFQTNAHLAVSEAVLKTVIGQDSSQMQNQHLPVQVSSFFFFPVKRDTPDTEVLELGTANVDIDSAASAMVGQFDTDLQGCVEALHPNKVETDKPHKRDFFTTASHFSESISECEQPPLEEQNLHPVADPSGTTKEVLSKVLTLYKDEMVGQNAECDITPAVSTQDKNRLLHLEAYFATPESPLQGSVEDYSNQTVTSVQDTAQQIAADVLLSAVRIISDSSDSYKVNPQISPVEAENVAPDLVTEVTNEVQKLLEATASTDTPASPCSDVEECIAKDLQSSHIFQTTVEDKVLAFLQEELTQSTDMDNSEDLQIDSIGGTNAQLMEEPQRPNANLLCASKCKLSESNFENEDCTVSPSQVPTSVREKLEKILCSERLNPHSHNLSNQIHHLYFKSQKGMTATKSVSDPLLVSVEEGGEFHRKRIVRQITQVYAEEMVKHCLLPCFNIPSDWTMEVGEHFQSASSSASCPSFLYSLSEVPKGASKSPSQILQNTLLVLIKTMIKDVMNILDLTLQSPEETEDQTDLQLLPDSTRLFRRPSSGEPAQMSLSEDIVIDSLDPLLTLVNSTSDDYTSLVTILVIRLLSKLNDQEPLTDDMLDISRSLIERIVTDIDAVLGPHGVRLRKVFRAIYNDLLHEFGSKEILLRVMMSEDPWFEKTLVTGEITSVTAKPKEGKPKKPTFLSKFSKMKAFLAIKRSKPSNNKKQSTNGDHPTTAQVDPTDRCAGCLPCVALFASGDKTVEKKPCKGFFSRMISRLSKKSSKIHPRTLD